MRSMTGFGRGAAVTESGTASVEISAVNRKQAEILIQGLRDLPELEAPVRMAAAARVSRGRLTLTISYRPSSTAQSAASPEVDLALALGLDSAFRQLSQHLGREILPSAADYLKVPGLIDFSLHRPDPEIAWNVISPALKEALDQLAEMKANEGRDLARDLSDRLERLASLAAKINQLAPTRADRHRSQLIERLAAAQTAVVVDDARLLQELALFADRCDISEELTRLDSHFRKFRAFLGGSEPAGRPLDFLCQEIHREFNTIGSKALDADIAQHVVSAKTELEKIREQVQNVE